MRGDDGDGGDADKAQLNLPYGVAVDEAGNVYIADSGNHRIRKVDSAGKIITTFAGTGVRGDDGDGELAVNATLNLPTGVAVDSDGNVYIADSGNKRIRKVDSEGGIITTFAGTGVFGFSGDGELAVNATLNLPTGVAVDSDGNVYIADSGNDRIRKVDYVTGIITTIAGTGVRGFSGDDDPAAAAQLSDPTGVAVDGEGNVYIADLENHRIRKVDYVMGIITTFAGTGVRGFGGDGGPADEAQLNLPTGVAVDSDDTVYIADSENHRIRKVDSAGKIITFAGTGDYGRSGDGGQAVDAKLGRPTGVAVDSDGNVYIADLSNHRIRKVDTTEEITTIAESPPPGRPGGRPAVQLSEPTGVAVDEAGNVYIADRENHRIHKVDSAGGIITTFAGTGVRGDDGDGGDADKAQLNLPYGVAVDEAGNVYIADSGNHRIRKVDSAGMIITTFAGTGVRGDDGDGELAVNATLNLPYGVAVDSDGNVYIADSFNNRIRKVDSAGTITTIAGTGEIGFSGDGELAVNAQLNLPYGVAVDEAGNVYIADSGNNRIRKLTPAAAPPPPRRPSPPPPQPGNFPTADAGPDQLGVWEGALVMLDGSGSSDPDDDPLRYRWNQISGEPVVLSSQNIVNPTFTAPQGLTADAVLQFRLLVTDPSSRFDSDTVTVTVDPEAEPPPAEDWTYYFPHLAVGAGWQTTITYINYTAEEVSCQTGFLSDQGTPLMVSFAGLGTVISRTDILPPGGSIHQETNVELTAPLVPGWARATCSGPVKASLLFRRHNNEGVPTAEAGVNAAAIPATRFVTFAEQGEGQFGTGVAYANPSATEVLVTFTARDADGLTLASATQELSASGHGAENMQPLFGLSSFAGSLEVTSTAPIVTLSLNFEAAPVFSSLPPGELEAAAQGSTTYYFPHLAVGASWQTTITYINYSPQEVSCTTDFNSDQGSPLMVSFADRGTVISRDDVLPPGGSVHQETNVELTAPLAPGWARATCSGPVKASLLYRQRNSEGVPTGEAGVNAATVPATRFVTFAEQGEGKSGTAVAYANPSATAALVTFTARDADGETLASVVRTLLAGGHDAQNMTLLFGLSSFTGSLEITSTEPIVSLSLNFEAAPVFSSLPPGESDGTR